MPKKITVAAVGGSGDVRPLIALGLKLSERGDTITLCAPPDFEQLVRTYGLEFYPVGINIQMAATKIAKEFIGKPISGLKSAIKFIQDLFPDQYSSLLSAAKGSELLIGGGILFTGSTVAEALGIPYAHVGHVPQVLKSAYHPPISTPWQNLPMLTNKVLWVGYEMLMSNTYCRMINKCRKKADLKRIGNPSLFGLKKMVIAMDKELGPIPPDVHDTFIQTGYWNLFEENELPQELEEFITAGSTPIYIGFGSMPDPSPEKTSHIIAETLNHLNVRAVISKGWAGLCENLKKDKVFLADPVPHWMLFPKMKAIVHHGGAGTSWSASYSGVPQVIVPHMADQYYWANRIFTLKLSPAPLHRSNMTGNRLAAAIQETTTNIEIKRSCKEIQDTLKKRDGLKEAIEQFDSFF